MASYADHVAQSWHNEAVANSILQEADYRDWAITAAFYTAVHVAEACFTKRHDIRHSETAYNAWRAAGNRGSMHEFREDKMRLLATVEAYTIYQALHQASQDLRYLTMRRDRQNLFNNFYTQSVAEVFVIQRLPKLRWEVAKTFNVDGGLYAIDPT